MEPRISIITLGVSDLGRSTRFYRDGLGFPEHEAGGDEITFLALTGQLLGPLPAGRPSRRHRPARPEGHAAACAARIHHRPQRGDTRRSGLRAAAGRDGRGPHRQARRRNILGRLLRVLRRSRRLPVGSRDRLRPAHRTGLGIAIQPPRRCRGAATRRGDHRREVFATYSDLPRLEPSGEIGTRSGAR